jgi:hypothetical protein
MRRKVLLSVLASILSAGCRTAEAEVGQSDLEASRSGESAAWQKIGSDEFDLASPPL